jgi:hypothetical protein
MTYQKQQGKGSASRTILDWEDGFGVELTSTWKPILIPFNTNTITGSRNLNTPATIRGDRNPTEPFQGNKDVAGSLAVPLDTNGSGYLITALMGKYVKRREVPSPNVMVGSPTVTIASGVATFSVAQTGAAVGDRLLYQNADGSQAVAYLTAETSDTVWDVDLARDGAGAVPDITAAVVDGIATNLAETSPGTVSITSGVATFSATHANLAAGQILFYEGTKVARIVSVLTATTATVLDMEGRTPANAAGVDVEAITAAPFVEYEWRIHPTAPIPSLMIEKGLLDLRAPFFERFSGCKVDTFEVSIGGDGELLATIGVVGAQSVGTYTPHAAVSKLTGSAPTVSIVGSTKVATFSEAQTGIAVGDVVVYESVTAGITGGRVVARSSDTVVTLDAVPGNETSVDLIAVYSPASTAVTPTAVRLQQFDATAYLDGVAVNVLKMISLRMGNNLDRDSFVIGGGGVRADLPEGIAEVGGNLEALFRDASIVDIAKNNQEASLRVRFTTSTTEHLEIEMPELKFQEKSVEINGPAGIVYNPDFQAYKTDASSAAIIRLRTRWLDYTVPASADFSLV